MSATTWSPTSFPGYPHTTSLSSVNPTKSAELQSILTNAVNHLTAATINKQDFISYSRALRGAEASLTIIQAQDVLSTATDQSVLSQATEAIYDSTINLLDLEWNEDSYNIWRLVKAPNIIYLIIFAATFLYTVAMIYKSRFHWYNISWTLGLMCELIGFIARVMSLNDMTNNNLFLTQLICLTIAPAFLMGGIYFLFAQKVVIHGRQYSLLKPMWYSYLFIGCDILSLAVQAGGGAQASIASNNYQNAKPGTDTMIAGIAFQVASMSVFMVFWYTFINRTYFKHNLDKDLETKGENGQYLSHTYDESLKKPSVGNFFKLLFNTKNANQYKQNHLDQFYNPKFQAIRARKLYNYFDFVISLAVLCIYVRCVYRVVELAQGFDGYLITHEVYLMVLDALMIAITSLLFVPFHPQHVFGDASQIRLKDIKDRNDTFGDVDENDENVNINSRDNLNETDNIELGEKGSDELEDHERDHSASDSSEVLQVEPNGVLSKH